MCTYCLCDLLVCGEWNIIRKMRSASLLLCPLGPPEHPCMNSPLQHVFNMWASGALEGVRGHLCLQCCLVQYKSQSCMSWRIISRKHFSCLSSDYQSVCLCLWKIMRRSICYPSVYVECVSERVRKLICIRRRSRGLASCWFSSTYPEGSKSG